MSDADADRRHSRALEPELIQDPTLKAEAEAANGLRQYDLAVQAVLAAIERHPFRLRVSLILSLHRAALQGISAYAGNWRPGDVGFNTANISRRARTWFLNSLRTCAST